MCLLSWSDSELTSKVITTTQIVLPVEKFICQGALIGEAGLGPGLHELAPNCLSILPLTTLYMCIYKWHLDSYFYFLAVKVHTCATIPSLFPLSLFPHPSSLSLFHLSIVLPSNPSLLTSKTISL